MFLAVGDLEKDRGVGILGLAGDAVVSVLARPTGGQRHGSDGTVGGNFEVFGKGAAGEQREEAKGE